MDKKSVKEHLVFFKQNNVDLNNPEIYVEIEKYFDRIEFIKNIDFLERNTLIVENDKRDSIYSITEKGNKLLSEIIKELEYESEKERVEFEKSKVDLKLNKWLLKTKWLPHFIAVISFAFTVYIYFDSKDDSKKLEERIEKIESTILNQRNVSKK